MLPASTQANSPWREQLAQVFQDVAFLACCSTLSLPCPGYWQGPWFSCTGAGSDVQRAEVEASLWPPGLCLSYLVYPTGAEAPRLSHPVSPSPLGPAGFKVLKLIWFWADESRGIP